VKGATSEPLGDGRYLVSLDVEARKFRADGAGVETEIGIDDWIDIGVFGDGRRDGRERGGEETVLFMQKRHITQPNMHIEVVVEGKPERAGIDPYNKLIDRDSNDNVRKVSSVEVSFGDADNQESVQDL
jgi:hypothetical protein